MGLKWNEVGKRVWDGNGPNPFSNRKKKKRTWNKTLDMFKEKRLACLQVLYALEEDSPLFDDIIAEWKPTLMRNLRNPSCRATT